MRHNGELNGEILGVLGVFFDWQEQARCIVCDEPNLTQEEWQRTRVLLLDNNQRIIAASDNRDIFSRYPLKMAENKGYYRLEDGTLVAFSKTLGYQEYDGLGWIGVIVQKRQEADAKS